MNGTARDKSLRGKAVRLSFNMYAAASSAPKNKSRLIRRLIAKERQTDCFTIRPMFPFCPRICSWAVRREMVVVKPAEVMLQEREYMGKIS